MRFISFAIIFFISVRINAQSKIDVLHYRFHVELNDNNDTIYGKAEIKLRFLESTSSVDFDLVQSANNSKGMIFLNASGYRMQGYMSRKPEILSLLLSQPAAKNDTATYIIHYKGIPADGLIISKNKYGHRTFFADNWPNRGHNWLPCNDHPADKAPVEFIVTAPQHYQVVANGIQVEETNLPGNKKLTHWKEDVPVSTKVMVIGVADFAVQQSGMLNDCIPVSSWIYPEDRDKGFYDYAQAAEILPWYIRNVGPYAYKKLANVQSKTTFGGLENANTIFYSENSVSGTRKSEGLIAHEIAHQWFGNMATEKTFAHLWLSEGFATYMTILYMENKYGTDTANKMLREDRDQVISFARTSNRPVVDSTETDYMALLNANSYQKGGWVLHMLRRELGDSVFWTCIRNYYSSYAGGIAGTDDLRAVFEKTSGKDLSQFFKQWLYTPGIPRLNVTWRQYGENIEITVEQLQEVPYHFSLDIKIVAGETKIRRLDMTDRKQSFLITVSKKATSVSLDPDVSLLFSGTIKEVR